MPEGDFNCKSRPRNPDWGPSKININSITIHLNLIEIHLNLIEIGPLSDPCFLSVYGPKIAAPLK